MALYGMSMEGKLMTLLWHVCGGEINDSTVRGMFVEGK